MVRGPTRIGTLLGRAASAPGCVLAVAVALIAATALVSALPRRSDRPAHVLRLPRGRTGAVRPCAFSPAGDRVIAVNDSGDLAVWSVAEGERLASFRVSDLGHPHRAIGFGPRGDAILEVREDGRLLERALPDGRIVRDAPVPPAPFWQGALSPDGRLLAVSDRGRGTMTIVSTADGATTATIASAGTAVFLDRERLAILPPHDRMGVPSSARFTVHALRDGALLDDVALPTVDLLDAVSSDGRLAAVASRRRLAVFDVRARARLWSVELPPPIGARGPLQLGHVAFSPAGDLVAAGNHGADALVFLLSTADGSLVRTLDAPATPTLLVFSPRGDALVSGADGAVLLWRN